MKAYVWTCRVKPEKVDEFRDAYVSKGDWAMLFSLSADYRGAELLKLSCEECGFMNIDYFQSPDGREKFIEMNGEAYALFDRQRQDATVEENFAGELISRTDAPRAFQVRRHLRFRGVQAAEALPPFHQSTEETVSDLEQRAISQNRGRRHPDASQGPEWQASPSRLWMLTFVSMTERGSCPMRINCAPL